MQVSSFTGCLWGTKVEHRIGTQKPTNSLTELVLASLPGEDKSNIDIEGKMRGPLLPCGNMTGLSNSILKGLIRQTWEAHTETRNIVSMVLFSF